MKEPESEYRINRDPRPSQPETLFKGQFCEPFYFVPTPSPNYEIREQRQDMTPGTRVVFDKMVGAFRGQHPSLEPFWQLPRQGQRCFLPIPLEEGFVSPKGSLGRSPGSENIQTLLDERFRAIHGDKAGCIRTEFGDGTDFLVVHKPAKSGDGTDVILAIPEGLSTFFLFAREYQALRHVYEPLGIRSPQPLALLHRNVQLPWTTVQEGKQMLSEKISTQLGVNTEAISFLEGLPVQNLMTDTDTGLLIQRFRTMVRPQHFYDLAIAGEWDNLSTACSTLENYPHSLLTQFAATAGKTIQNGVIHGILYYDYQNMTVAGELVDADRTVVAPSINPELASRFESILEHDSKRFGIDAIIDDYRFVQENVAPNEMAAAKSLLEQSYYLWNASLRSIDISGRAQENNNIPGTILSPDEIDRFRLLFVRTMLQNLGDRGREVIQMATLTGVDIDTDFRAPEEPPMLRFILETKSPTIFGWTNPNKPFNHFIHHTTEEDIAFIIQDYNTFVHTVLETL